MSMINSKVDCMTDIQDIYTYELLADPALTNEATVSLLLSK